MGQVIQNICLRIPEFPKVLAEHLPHVLNKVVHIQLKPVSKNIEDYEVDFLCLM